MNILLVDSTPLYQEILVRHLADAGGFSLVRAGSTAEALAAVQEGRFDFYIVAGQLPDGDGMGLARRLRESGRAPFEPVVLLTGSASERMNAEAGIAGVTEIFRRQDIDELAAFMGRFLEIHRPAPCRILYVEDAGDQRQWLTAQMADWGMRVDAYASAEEAWQALGRETYDLALCDVVLDGRMSGSRFINRIRRQPGEAGRLPILAATAFDHPARRIELFHLGVDDYIAKPIVPLELKARMRNLLGHRRTLEQNRQLLRATQLGVTTVDADGRIAAMDDNARAMFGCADGSPLGRPLADFLPGLDHPPADLEKLRVEGRRADGGALAVEITSLALKGTEDPERMALLSRDLTGELELQKRLTRAKEEAERAARLKAEFLSNMSHEIRTPLSAILGMVHLSQREGVAGRLAERLEKIDTAGRHLLDLVNAILDLSKIEAGRFVLEERETAVAGILANVASILHERVVGKGLALVVEADGLPDRLLGDPLRLQQALLNYANNALKFTERGTITLAARAEDAGGEGVLVRFEVRDTGMGIDPAEGERLFAPFEQAEAATARRFGGTGLGLAITRELARLMGGETGATGAPGEGSRFWFTARLRRPPADAVAPGREAAAAEQCLRDTCGGKRILLVEDEPINAEVARELLEGAGLEVAWAEDGIAALEHLAAAPCDLVLMDLQMPRLGGIEATRRIRALAGGARLPVVAMTANAFAEDRARCLAAGMDDFLAKPVVPERLFAVVLAWLTAGRR